MELDDKALLDQGLKLPLMEEFYSIQGEGVNVGEAAYFIRLGGCDNGCSWCDVKESWEAAKHALVTTDQIIAHVVNCKAKAVVVTGGEPMLYNLDYFCKQVQSAGVRTFLETSGSDALSGSWDWICLSPKPSIEPMADVCENAHELKVVVATEVDLQRAEKYANKVSNKCVLLLQPEWSRREKMMPVLVDYVKQHPQWKISLQTHKYLGIP